MHNINSHRRNSSLIVELVGPAGAGKTTLSWALSRCDEKFEKGPELELRKLGHIPLFAAHAPGLLPLLLQFRRGKQFTWEELKAMTYLKGWPQVLGRRTANGSAAILLDHGPIFKLATLNAFGPEWFNSRDFKHWWDNTIRQWASTLDMVIWLDALDADLVSRINTRVQRHAFKGKPQREAVEFLARYRASYEEILAKLAAYGGPEPIRFNTSEVSTGQIVDEVLDRCDSISHEARGFAVALL